MRFFELDIDENQLRGMVKEIIDRYEKGLSAHGHYADAVKQAQEETVQNFEDSAEIIEMSAGAVIH